MHKRFNHQEFEKKWQEKWSETGLYAVGARDESKEKEYVLIEWPYPSGNLHIGHWYAFAVPDIYVRMRRMQGKQVLFPMGFDAFGLPAENAAIKNNVNPRDWTEKNIDHMRAQLASMGNAFSWNKTCSSTDQDYYRWTQWMFTKFFENDIAYRGEGVVNWCPGCSTVIANEQVQADGTCDRSGDVIEKKKMPQWMLRITEFADELIDDLETVNWAENIKEAQRNWIGRSSGAEIDFKLSTEASVTVFTTRPDTLYGATYLVIAPEHDLVTKLQSKITNWGEVAAYIQETKQLAEQDRLDNTKEKTGVLLKGVTATNPASGEVIPVYIANYVLASYGTGAVMAVPAHDERDYAFAKKYDLPIKQVMVPCMDDPDNPPEPQYDLIKRDTVVVHLRDRSTGKYALLNWHGPQEGIKTAIMGGIEEGQTPEEAALAEISEETAIPNAKIVKTSRWITAAKYCARHKATNRCAHTYSLLAEVEDLSEQGDIPENERKLHTLTWHEASEMRNLITPKHQKQIWDLLQSDEALLGSGYVINSEEYDEMDSEDAKEAIVKKVNGRLTNTYRLRDWSVGRQRYWGVPIPIVYDPQGNAHVVPEEHLPWTLPEDVDFKPTGEPPLAKSKELLDRTERIFGAGWKPEVETMDTFVDSSWYFLRYIDNENTEHFSSTQAQKDWMQVDTYFGGAEHTTMHLLYSRFWQKALKRLGLVEHKEPYVSRHNRGLILGPDGNKMSKSKGNVIDPDEQVALVGADTVKMYLAFMGPYIGANYPWDNGGIAGIHRFLERVYGLSDHVVESIEHNETTKLLHKTIEKVTRDIAEYKFNTAVSALMIYVNQAEKTGLSKDSYEMFIRLLAPFAPHLTEELWYSLGKSESVHAQLYPVSDPSIAADEEVTIGVQINGKLRGEITLSPTAPEEEAWELIEKHPSLSKQVLNQEIVKKIYVPGRIYNIILAQ